MTVPLGSVLVPQMKNDAISVAPPSKTILDRMGGPPEAPQIERIKVAME